MSYDQLVSEVADRLNLTSTQALTRIGRSINERYRWLVTSLGIQAAARTRVNAQTVIGNPEVTFIGVTKLWAVFLTAPTPDKRLDERDFTQLRNSAPIPDPPTEFAVRLQGANSVTILLNSVPGTVYTLQADASENLVPLSGSMEPRFPVDYHDILIYGAMATELYKMEKAELGKGKEDLYTLRVADLRAYLAR